MKETHPFQVRTWLPEIPTTYGIAFAHWTEKCRCKDQATATQIAKALHLTTGMIYAVVTFSNEKVGVTYLSYHPDQERAIAEGAIDPPKEVPAP